MTAIASCGRSVSDFASCAYAQIGFLTVRLFARFGEWKIIHDQNTALDFSAFLKAMGQNAQK